MSLRVKPQKVLRSTYLHAWVSCGRWEEGWPVGEEDRPWAGAVSPRCWGHYHSAGMSKLVGDTRGADLGQVAYSVPRVPAGLLLPVCG